MLFMDVGGVLEDRTAVDGASLEIGVQVARRLGFTGLDAATVREYRAGVVAAFGERPWENRYFYWHGLLERAGAQNPGTDLVDDAYTAYLSAYRTLVACYPDVTPALVELDRRGVRMGLLTNATRRKTDAFLESTGIGRFFSVRAVSEEFGTGKPSQQFFRFAARLAGVSPSECFHVGDRVENDYSPALAVGMGAVLLNRSGQLSTDPEQGCARVTSLRSLPDLLAPTSR